MWRTPRVLLALAVLGAASLSAWGVSGVVRTWTTPVERPPGSSTFLAPPPEQDRRSPNHAPAGKNLYQAFCSSCHACNGTRIVGPPLDVLFRKLPDGAITGESREVVRDGRRRTITVDDAYLRESIRHHRAAVVVGYEQHYSTDFDAQLLDERRVDALIAWMRSLAR